jgi:hypothetical protein
VSALQTLQMLLLWALETSLTGHLVKCKRSINLFCATPISTRVIRCHYRCQRPHVASPSTSGATLNNLNMNLKLNLKLNCAITPAGSRYLCALRLLMHCAAVCPVRCALALAARHGQRDRVRQCGAVPWCVQHQSFSDSYHSNFHWSLQKLGTHMPEIRYSRRQACTSSVCRMTCTAMHSPDP